MMQQKIRIFTFKFDFFPKPKIEHFYFGMQLKVESCQTISNEMLCSQPMRKHEIEIEEQIQNACLSFSHTSIIIIYTHNQCGCKFNFFKILTGLFERLKTFFWSGSFWVFKYTYICICKVVEHKTKILFIYKLKVLCKNNKCLAFSMDGWMDGSKS